MFKIGVHGKTTNDRENLSHGWRLTQMKTICCAAGYGEGGLGRHLAELVESARADGELERYFSHAPRRDDDRGRTIARGNLEMLFRYTPLRFSPSWKAHLTGDRFDRKVSGQLHEPPQTLVCFAGQALHTFRRAAALGCRRLELIAANSHVNNVRRQHEQAAAQWNIEPSWLNQAQQRKMLAEYQLADLIHVASAYAYDTFIREGLPPARLALTPLRPHPRYVPAIHPSTGVDRAFQVIYVGSITVAKGIPVLLEAFRRLEDPAAQLLLVGGTATRPMRKYMEQQMARDPRVRLASGDPLPHLRRASIYIHPSYDDGFGYAPMEALACGLPAIVTDHTGMKEHIREGINGQVVPTGDVPALVAALRRWKQILETRANESETNDPKGRSSTPYPDAMPGR
jgi:glycosyltransferase involved in cell wall biosynthesis